MPVVPLSIFIDKSVYAKRDVTLYGGNFKTIKGTVKKGGFIGVCYSWVLDKSTGFFYLMFYRTQQDYNNFNAVYCLLDSKDLNVLGLQESIDKIIADQKALEQQQLINEKGLLQYYLDKYLPFIVGGIVLYFAAPGIKSLINGNSKK